MNISIYRLCTKYLHTCKCVTALLLFLPSFLPSSFRKLHSLDVEAFSYYVKRYGRSRICTVYHLVFFHDIATPNAYFYAYF